MKISSILASLLRSDQIYISNNIAKFCDTKANENYMLFSELVEKNFPGYRHTSNLTLEPTEVAPTINYENLIKVLSSKDANLLNEYNLYFEGMTKYLDGTM